jgi:hypothetical protein
MKIIKNTQEILKFNNKTEWDFKMRAGCGLLLAIPICLISVLVVLSSGTAKLSCTKLELKIAACELGSSTFIGLIQNRSTSIDRVQSAIVETVNTTDSDGNSVSNKQTFLVTNKEKIEIPNQFDDEDTKLVNKYLQTAVGGLVIEKDDRLQVFISMLSINIGLVLIMLLLAGAGTLNEIIELKTYIFDKNAGIVTINKKLGIRVRKQLQEISQVELEETEDSDENKSYEVRLLMNGGDRISLGNSSNRREQEEMADLIRSYIDGRSPSDAI